MRYGRIIFGTILIFTLSLVGFVLAQGSSAAVVVLPGSGSVGTGYTITIIGFAAEKDVSLTVTHVDQEAIYFQTTLTTDDEGSASTVIHSQRDDAPGEYLVQARAEEGVAATASFQILSTEEAEERAAPALRYQDAIAIENGEWSGETTEENSIIAYSFSAQSGDILNATLHSPDFDAYLVLLNAAGDEITMDDDSGPELDAHIADFTLPGSGEYTLLVSSWRYYHLEENSSVGQFQLDFHLISEASPSTTVETAPRSADTETDPEGNQPKEINDALSESAPLMRYTFRAAAGQSITISLRSDEFDPYLMIDDATGETLASDDDGDGGLNARIEDYTFSEAGEYTIVVSSWEYIHVDETVTGAYQLLVWGGEIDWVDDDASDDASSDEDSAPPPEPQSAEEQAEAAEGADEAEADADEADDAEESTATTETESSEPAAPASESDADDADVDESSAEVGEIPIAYGDRLAPPIGESELGLRFALQGQAGDLIDIAVSSYSKLDTQITVHAPDGTLLASDDDSGRGYNPELLGLYLPQDGTYLISLDPVWQGDGQPVSIAIDLREPLHLAEGALQFKLSSKQNRETVILHVEETGEIRLRAQVEGESADGIRFEALQSGHILASLQHSGISEIEWLFPAPETGEIRMSFTQLGEGQVSLTIERIETGDAAESSAE
ncbi:MAG: pre-peptidase C-terminal domain-containing protein [Chloroflexi bacterium]|nr:pre-peptidase C-terminal domain-containing protein [Chloroflexota bacterium]